MFLVAATLRPETVFGQTNFWVNPSADYVKAKVGDEVWVVSEDAYFKLTYQMDGIERVGPVKGSELIGLKCLAPMVRREILTLPADFVDPNVGTGRLPPSLQIPRTTGYPEGGPERRRRSRTIRPGQGGRQGHQADSNHRDEGLVRPSCGGGHGEDGHHGPGRSPSGGGQEAGVQGRVPHRKDERTAGDFAGLPVMEAKERMKQMMIASGEAAVMYDLSETVTCRCGERVVIRKVDDQWFIDYANAEATAASKEQAKNMEIFPVEYYQNIHGVLDWFRERACVRQGNWIGTKFPFDEKWIIEAISDSTLYPIYYTISKFANDGSIRAEQMTEEFFDLVILDKGDAGKVSASTAYPRRFSAG